MATHPPLQRYRDEHRRQRRRRALIAAAAWVVLALVAMAARADAVTVADGWAALRRDGAIVLFRHADAPGVGDPPGFRLGDCATQRNLDANGRAQARRIGQTLVDNGITVAAVWTSRWCRARDTARLLGVAPVVERAAFDSSFNLPPSEAAARTARARGELERFDGPGALVVVTHQVNITALTRVVPASGEGVVVRADTGGVRVLGRIAP